jgi:hypothetical protein
MFTDVVRHPVRLLRDHHGIYGISAETNFVGDMKLTSLILRRDLLADADMHYRCYPVLQPIFGGTRHGLFWYSLEEHMRQEIHHELLARRGLPWPRVERWWSSDPKQQARNRQMFHGLRLKSLAIINALIRQALSAAAEPDALKLARRFQFQYRYWIYRAAALNHRAMQLAEAFPALAVAIYIDADKQRNQETAMMVEAGAPLRRVAEVMNIPMALRWVKPRAARAALAAAEVCRRDPKLFHAHMPDSLPRAALWLRAIRRADDSGPEFVEWTAQHCLQISNEPEALFSTLDDLSDWVKAGYRAQVPPHVRRALLGRHNDAPSGEQFVTRPFSPDMSLRTVMKLSAEWHEAVANNMNGPDQTFPPPWCGAGQSNGYEIIPITTAGDLYLEGRAMHHCAGTLTRGVSAGRCYLFSIREHGERVATLELVRGGEDQARVGQLRGPCNAQVSKSIKRAVRVWLREQRPRLPSLPKRNKGEIDLEALLDQYGANNMVQF